MKMRLLKLTLRNFKKAKLVTVEADGDDVNIYGDNETGKTTIMDAFLWLLFGKDSENKKSFPIKTLDENGEALHNLEHEVEGMFDLNGKMVTLKKVFKEKYTRQRGSVRSEFTGHTTDYFINEVPVKESDYAEKIKAIAPEELFRLLTNPLYFNENIAWKERRDILLKVCGNVSDSEVIESDPELKGITSILQSRTVDEHKQVLQSKMKKINDRIKEIPIRISEVQRNAPDVDGIDFAEIKGRILLAQDAEKQLRKELTDLSMSDEATSAQKKLLEIDTEIIKYKNKFEEDKRIALTPLKDQESTLQLDIARLSRESTDKNSLIEDKKAVVGRLENAVSKLRESWNTVHAEKCENSQTCPTCGQDLPQEKVAEAVAAFNLSKSQRKENINAEGKRAAKELEETKKQLEKLESEHNYIKLKLDSANNTLNTVLTKLDKASQEYSDVTQSPGYKVLLAQKAQIEATVGQGNSNKDKMQEVQGTIDELNKKIPSLQATFAKKEQVEAANKRIAELSDEEKKLAGEYEQLERELHLTEQFIKAKVSMLTEKINSSFEFARFKLFNQQINGGVEECCEVTYKGVPYGGGMNKAARINVGMDIINTLSKYYNFTAPVFIDNAESVTELAHADTQVIRLVVSKPDKTLRIERIKENAEVA